MSRSLIRFGIVVVFLGVVTLVTLHLTGKAQASTEKRELPAMVGALPAPEASDAQGIEWPVLAVVLSGGLLFLVGNKPKRLVNTSSR